MKKNQKGSMLLEYTAAAAVMIGIVWLSMNAMGQSLSTVFVNITNWANDRSDQIGGGE